MRREHGLTLTSARSCETIQLIKPVRGKARRIVTRAGVLLGTSFPLEAFKKIYIFSFSLLRIDRRGEEGLNEDGMGWDGMNTIVIEALVLIKRPLPTHASFRTEGNQAPY